MDPPLSPHEHTRQALHHSIDRIVRAWPLALEDANARGYVSSNYNTRTAASENTSVEQAALTPCRAVGWLAELADIINERSAHGFAPIGAEPMRKYFHWVIENWWPPEHWVRRVIRLGNTAEMWWPPTPELSKTIGAQLQDAETCLYCTIDAYPGDRRAIKLPDGSIEGYVHKNPCWYAWTVTRKQHTITPIAMGKHHRS